MKAIVVTDQAAGLAGMKLAERPKPPAAPVNSNRWKGLVMENCVARRDCAMTAQC